MTTASTTFRCEACALRARAEANPKSLISCIWKWHIGWCPGWKAYQAHLAELAADKSDPSAG
jgi:hypothetical protein